MKTLRALIGLTLLSLSSGCTDRPAANYCDYCKTSRPWVWKNRCDVCGGEHVSCDLERTLWVNGWDGITLSACPKR